MPGRRRSAPTRSARANNPYWAVSHEELGELAERQAALRALDHMLATKFASMRFVLDKAVEKLPMPKHKKHSFLMELANAAASAAGAGAAGAVAEALARRLTARVTLGSIDSRRDVNDSPLTRSRTT